MIRNRSAVLSVIILVLGVSAGALAQDTVRLELKFTPGEVLRYKMVMDGVMTMTSTDPSAPQMRDVPMRMVAIIREQVKRVLPSGDAEVSAAIESMKITGAGKSKELPRKGLQALTMVIGTDGQVRSMHGNLESKGGMRFMNPGTLGQFGALPSGDLAVGESWSRSAPFPMGGGKMLLIGRLIGMNDKIGDTRVATVQQDITGDIDLVSQLGLISDGKLHAPPGVKAGGTFRGSGTTFFSPEKGRVMRTECSFEADMEGSGLPHKGATDDLSMSFRIKFEMFLMKTP